MPDKKSIYRSPSSITTISFNFRRFETHPHFIAKRCLRTGEALSAVRIFTRDRSSKVEPRRPKCPIESRGPESVGEIVWQFQIIPNREGFS